MEQKSSEFDSAQLCIRTLHLRTRIWKILSIVKFSGQRRCFVLVEATGGAVFRLVFYKNYSTKLPRNKALENSFYIGKNEKNAINFENSSALLREGLTLPLLKERHSTQPLPVKDAVEAQKEAEPS